MAIRISLGAAEGGVHCAWRGLACQDAVGAAVVPTREEWVTRAARDGRSWPRYGPYPPKLCLSIDGNDDGWCQEVAFVGGVRGNE
jgi:hypothetical protein